MNGAPPRVDRRTSDRRSRRRMPNPDESWFGSGLMNTDLGALPSADERSANGTARAQATATPAFDRIRHAILAARAALGVALMVTLAVAAGFGVRPSVDVVLVSLAYAVLAVAMWWMPTRWLPDAAPANRRRRLLQWAASVGIDIVCFFALHVLSPSSSLNYVALLVLPILSAGVLMPRTQALAVTSMVALALLGSAWLTVLAGGDGTTLMTQAGLAGIGFFLIATLAGELSARLAREEISAKDSLELARQQTELNRLVIEEMQDGVLVVDRQGRVRAANPAARKLLAAHGMAGAAPFQLRRVPAWDALVKTVERAFAEAVWPEAGRDVVLAFAPEQTRTLRVRIRFTRRDGGAAGEELCVLLLEDERNMEARTRQEKLAAMGRVSAGIAHEIRNPLSAIAQANALLSEDATTPAQRQLTQMVADNAARLKRIVDDVMEVAPGRPRDTGVIDIGTLVATACADWARSALVPAGVLRADVPPEPLGTAFEPDHLRRVLINLLENGHRHSSRRPGSVHVRLYAPDDATVCLSVSSDGDPIAPEVERYLFEPFFSTRSRGTGLGLYICRELCERHGATIDYRLRQPGEANRNEFLVAMRRQPLPVLGEPRLPFST